jgi:hypothetical protein
VVAQDIADHQLAAVRLRAIHHAAGIGDRGRQRLFDEDMAPASIAVRGIVGMAVGIGETIDQIRFQPYQSLFVVGFDRVTRQLPAGSSFDLRRPVDQPDQISKAGLR